MTTDLLCERDRLMESAITLDGKPAKLAGRLCAYGTVWSMTDGDAATMQAVDFSWLTIHHVIATGGHFRSQWPPSVLSTRPPDAGIRHPVGHPSPLAYGTH